MASTSIVDSTTAVPSLSSAAAALSSIAAALTSTSINAPHKYRRYTLYVYRPTFRTDTPSVSRSTQYFRGRWILEHIFKISHYCSEGVVTYRVNCKYFQNHVRDPSSRYYEPIIFTDQESLRTGIEYTYQWFDIPYIGLLTDTIMAICSNLHIRPTAQEGKGKGREIFLIIPRKFSDHPDTKTVVPGSLPGSLPELFPTRTPTQIPPNEPDTKTVVPGSLPGSLPELFPTRAPTQIPPNDPDIIYGPDVKTAITRLLQS
jgi:hypothetical protein